MPLRHPPKRPKIDPNRLREATFSLLNSDLVFGLIFAPFCLPKCLPFSAILPLKTDQKIDPKSDCSKSRSKIAPRPPKTRPRCPPDPPGAPKMPSRTALDGPNGFSEAPGPRRFFGKFEIGRSITKSSLASVAHKAKKGVGGWGGKSTTVIHGGHSHRSLKNRKHFHNGRNPEGGGGGRAKRSSINL